MDTWIFLECTLDSLSSPWWWAIARLGSLQARARLGRVIVPCSRDALNYSARCAPCGLVLFNTIKSIKQI